jgi:polysaccharide export outer membrane protein
MTMNSARQLCWGICLMATLSSCLWAQKPAEAPKQMASAALPAAESSAPAIADKNRQQYVIGNDDVLAINVWKEPEITRSLPVRSDGKISLPLIGEVQAAGNTPPKLEQEIASRLRNFIAEPDVTVIVQQVNSQKFSVLGQVNKPGAYPLANSATVLDAIAIAGGFRDFAKKKSMYVLRDNGDGSSTRITFNYNQAVKGDGRAQNVRLAPHDTVVVP